MLYFDVADGIHGLAMEINRTNIVSALYESIRELNELRSKDQQLECALNTSLNETSGLDSLGFVNLIALIEEKCEQQFGKSLMLSDVDASAKDPFESVGALADFIESELAESTAAHVIAARQKVRF
jgi:acyl carrier protein